jgi:hypothetical protein
LSVLYGFLVVVKAEGYFERALAVAATTGKVVGAARGDEHVPECGAICVNNSRPAIFSIWFTEGFDRRDLKDANAPLDELT